jgi:ABC-type antimicrobial peptide transport system permease subunit
VSQGSREIGIRMALGAPRRAVVLAVAREAAVLVGVGTAAGLAVTHLAILALRGVTVPAVGFAGFRPATDLASLAAIAAFLAAIGLAAAIVPARRAATMDPLTALRRD